VIIGYFLTRLVIQDFKDFPDLDGDYDDDPHHHPDLGSGLGVMTNLEKMERFLTAF